MDKINEKFGFQVKLKCHSPIIHFQHDKPGATLRATEVKPKLDRFLNNKAEKNNFDIPKEWYVKNDNTDKKAFDYKMRIEACDGATAQKPHKIFYGNTGVKDETLIKKSLIGDCEFTIICFIPELLKFIKSNITEFFIVTNFGTMQGKGFGSFIPEKNKTTDVQNAKYLCDASDSPRCYVMTFRNNNTFYMFNEIKNLCSAMKSRGNFSIGEYFYSQKHISSESRWKKHGFPISNQYQYTRALLGIGSSIANLTVSHNEIERFPFPIFFKIIDNSVFFVANEIDNRIYNTEFNFGGHKISTPNGDKFDINSFLSWFVRGYSTINRNISIRVIERK